MENHPGAEGGGPQLPLDDGQERQGDGVGCAGQVKRRLLCTGGSWAGECRPGLGLGRRAAPTAAARLGLTRRLQVTPNAHW